jgi:hypothetical protein
MVSFPATLLLLVVAPALERGVDIILLPSLGPSTEKDDQHLTVPAEINPAAGTAIDLQLGDALTDRLDVGCVLPSLNRSIAVFTLMAACASRSSNYRRNGLTPFTTYS